MAIAQLKSLPPELVSAQAEMEEHARHYGLDFFPTIFELVDVKQLNAVAAYGGFPTRYPHWRFGMEYQRLAKGYDYGLQKIYELVINNDPCYAYLLESNSLTDHRMVMAHVYGHCDFFKCNAWFAPTNRHMIDEMANHGNRIRRYMDRFGRSEVEEFIDVCLSIEDLIDIHAPFIRRAVHRDPYEFPEPVDEAEQGEAESDGRFVAKDYMDRFVNPPEVLRKERDRRTEAARQSQLTSDDLPTRDVMAFLIQHAPLRSWQLDVLSMIRSEAYYFAPQGQTKIMNEGWATFWHTTIMTRHGLAIGDVISYADHTSGTLASSPTRLNPYKLGVELFRDIEDRWNRGCFGQEYDQCDSLEARQQWNTETGVGRQKIFEVRRIHNDVTFVDEFLTLDFCRRHKMFQFGFNEDSGYYEIESREFEKVKQQVMFSLTNLGRPIIRVVDGNYRNRAELLLEHEFNGPELRLDYARATLENLFSLWRRPVHLVTSLEQQETRLSYDGTQHETTQGGDVKEE